MILAGDVGGAHTRLAFFKRGRQVSETRKYASRSFPSLEAVLQEFLREEKQSFSKVCFGLAGPVRDGICKTTNLPWIIDVESLRRKLRVSSIFLLNDLEATAYGIGVLKPEEFQIIQPGLQDQKGNRVLIAASTGLGEAGLYWDGKKHHPFACEGGHVDFAPRNEEEAALFFHLQKQFPHVSYERIVSVPGLRAIYEFLVQTGRKPPVPSKDPDATMIAELGREKKDPTCAYALDWFLSLYGAEAGNLALKFLALGGCYICGGLAPFLADRLRTSEFLSSFCEKGRFRDLLASVPIWAVLNPNATLLGAAAFGESQ